MPKRLPNNIAEREAEVDSRMGSHAERKNAKERVKATQGRPNRTEALALLDWKNEKREVKPEEIFKFAQMGATYEEIGQWYGVTKSTMYKKISQDLELLAAYERGTAEVKMSLRRAQLESAITKGNPISQIWLGKQLLQQRDQPEIVIADSDKKQQMPEWLEQKLKEGGNTTPSQASSDSTPT